MQNSVTRTPSQRILRTLSIIEIVFAILTIIFGILSLMGGTAVSVGDPSLTAELAQNGMTQSEASGMLFGLGITTILDGVLSIIIAIFGIRASNDASKIMPAWYFAVLGLALSVFDVILKVVNGTVTENLASLLSSLALSILMFWVCNNVKAEAGK